MTTWEVTPEAAFVMGYLYAGALHLDAPIHIMKRTFDNGTCEVWGGVRNKPNMVGTWWPIATVKPEELDACAEACVKYLSAGPYPLKADARVHLLSYELLI